VVAITRDQSTPSASESATPAETVDATWTDATATDPGAGTPEPSEPSKTDGLGESV
jgi:hypothetical protein